MFWPVGLRQLKATDNNIYFSADEDAHGSKCPDLLYFIYVAQIAQKMFSYEEDDNN